MSPTWHVLQRYGGKNSTSKRPSRLVELHKNAEATGVVKPKFSSEAHLKAVVSETTDDLTLRTEEVETQKLFINPSTLDRARWRPPLMDEDGHPFSQAIYLGVESQGWYGLYQKYVEMYKEVNAKNPSGTWRSQLWLWKKPSNECSKAWRRRIRR